MNFGEMTSRGSLTNLLDIYTSLSMLLTMDEKVYDDFTKMLTLVGKSRRELRTQIVQEFLLEKGGYWKDNTKHVTRYHYYVETLGDGRRIFLYRPTFLNKGIDFQVWVERFKDGEDKKPSHKDIFNDLKLKREEDSEKYSKLLEAIECVWNCEDPDKVVKRFGGVSFKNGYPIDLILKVLKWLFIEQDVTYWNYDGRGMLMLAILKTGPKITTSQ